MPGGRPFEEHFTLSSTKLGDGMTACVFVCNDRATGALRACKVAERRGQRPAWSRLCQLLLHESSLLQEIGIHPNVVRWEGCFTSNHRIAIVMELVSGGDCQQMLQRHGSLPEETSGDDAPTALRPQVRPHRRSPSTRLVCSPTASPTACPVAVALPARTLRPVALPAG